MKITSRKNILHKSLVMITLIIFLASSYRVPYTKAQIETTVLGIDSADDIEAGTTFVLSIYLVNVSKTTGVGLDLTWDPSVLLMQTVIVNPSAPTNTTLWSQKIDNDIGSLKFALVNTNPPDYITAIQKTPILDLTFEAIGLPGNSTILSLENVELSDEYFEVYSPDVVTDGFVSIIEPEVVNQNPIADAGGSYSGVEGKTITFDGTGSYDPDGTIVSYEWSFGDGGTGTGSTPSHVYASTGTYTVTLTVTDDEGATGSDTTTTTISKPAPPPSPPSPPPMIPQNVDPVANAGPNRTVYVDVAIHYSGADSHDPDGTINAYHWFFGDGGYEAGVKVMHVYEEAGIYNASLTVIDNNGASSTDECTVTVQPMPVEPQAKIFDTVPANHTGYVVDALDVANTTVTVNTTGTVIITVIKYESNPYPEDPMPDAGVPKYADIYVSYPAAVVWPIYVELFYTHEEIEGLEESSLGIYYWFNGTWQRCSDTGVDAELNVVWAYMTAEEASGSPILIGGITSLKPAEFVVSYLKIEPRQIELGGTVTISVNVTNVGETPGSYNVTLNIEEDLIISVKEVTLQGGESEIVEFEFVPEAEGTYDVDIEGMIGTIYVIIPIPVPPLPPYLSNLTVTPTEIELGDNVTISLDIMNMDNQSFTYIVTMRIDELTLLIDVELEPYEFKTVSRTLTPNMIGEYHVWIQGITGGFKVKAPPKPAEFVVSDLEVAPDRVVAGEVVTITVEVENIGEKEGTHTVLLDVDGLVTEMTEITLDGGESTTVTFTITEAAGGHTVGVEDLTGDFTVTAPGISPGYVAVIIIVIVAATLLYAKWKGILPPLHPEVDAREQ